MSGPGFILPIRPSAPLAPGVQLRSMLSSASIVRENEPMARRTTLRVGGPADVFVEPASESDLQTVMAWCRAQNLPWLVLGRGSNLLVRDGGIRGVVISFSRGEFSRIEISGDSMRCGAGARLKQVAVEARRAGLGGFEFLEGIPGSVGGAVRMNAGAMGGATFDLVQQVRFMTEEGEILERPRSDFHVEYRSCPSMKSRVALAAVFRGERTSPEEIGKRMKQFAEKRWTSQPAAPSAGCMFKNTPTAPAGRLVEELGLKGNQIGAAAISTVHGNFIVNHGGARAQDVIELMALVQKEAFARRGIELELEVQIVGEDLHSAASREPRATGARSGGSEVD